MFKVSISAGGYDKNLHHGIFQNIQVSQYIMVFIYLFIFVWLA